jgi:hypothetical protein
MRLWYLNLVILLLDLVWNGTVQIVVEKQCTYVCYVYMYVPSFVNSMASHTNCDVHLGF